MFANNSVSAPCQDMIACCVPLSHRSHSVSSSLCWEGLEYHQDMEKSWLVENSCPLQFERFQLLLQEYLLCFWALQQWVPDKLPPCPLLDRTGGSGRTSTIAVQGTDPSEAPVQAAHHRWETKDF